MRLATFNVLHGRSNRDGLVDLDRFTAAVAGLDADVLALQEVDHHQSRSGDADLTALAAAAMGAVDRRFVPALDGTPGVNWRPGDGPARAGSPAYGIALLSRLPVRSWQVIRLEPVPWRVPMVFPGRRTPHKPVLVTDEPRVAVAAEVETDWGVLTVATTHLTFIPGWNTRQLRIVRRRLAGDLPLALMGDLNMGPAQARRWSGMRSLVSAPTFPLESPRQQLDHILGEGLVALPGTGHARRTEISDHRALCVSVRRLPFGRR